MIKEWRRTWATSAHGQPSRPLGDTMTIFDAYRKTDESIELDIAYQCASDAYRAARHGVYDLFPMPNPPASLLTPSQGRLVAEHENADLALRLLRRHARVA